jgi:hypothetical protein
MAKITERKSLDQALEGKAAEGDFEGQRACGEGD